MNVRDLWWKTKCTNEDGEKEETVWFSNKNSIKRILSNRGCTNIKIRRFDSKKEKV